jgi:hypothetical protein
MEAVPAKGHSGQHDLAHHGGVPGDDVQRDARAKAVAEQVSPVNAQAGQQGQRVISHRLDRHGPVDVGGPAMALLLHGDDLPGLCQPVGQRPE